ncbi:MAG: hypothetical protein ACLFS7_06385 [Desulfosudaceae bacterium]
MMMEMSTAGAIKLVIIAMMIMATPAAAMDAMTAEELDALSGQAGLTITFGDTFTTKASFTSLNIGDGDGTGVGQGVGNPGWLVLTGNGTNTAEMSVTISDGTHLKVNAATAGAGGFTPAGTNYGLIDIPAGKPFFTFSLSDTDIGLKTPETVYLSLSDTAGVITDTVGFLSVDNLMIDKEEMTSTLYIWTHN